MIYLIVNMIGRFLSGGKKKGRDDDSNIKNAGGKKGFPDDMGEYIDYEEVDDED
ncbi:MAG: hypothetical protein RQ743_03980 [Bacteroidales bacterium]|nr:hypothetical protein [Bacteroidales bacterium]